MKSVAEMFWSPMVVSTQTTRSVLVRFAGRVFAVGTIAVSCITVAIVIEYFGLLLLKPLLGDRYRPPTEVFNLTIAGCFFWGVLMCPKKRLPNQSWLRYARDEVFHTVFTFGIPASAEFIFKWRFIDACLTARAIVVGLAVGVVIYRFPRSKSDKRKS